MKIDRDADLEIGKSKIRSTRCDVNLRGEGSFLAINDQAMPIQKEIVLSHIKSRTERMKWSYGVSVCFALISASIIIWAPEYRSTAANVFAAAFLISASGLAGFTNITAKSPGIEFEGARDQNLS